jgi:WD40 repeat protein
MADHARESEAGWAEAWSVPPEVLVKGDPDRVRALLDGSQLLVSVYEASGAVHRRAAAGVRRQLLALDAARYGQPQLAAEIRKVAVCQETDDPWIVQWATGTGLDSRLRYALPAPANAGVVATVVVEGRGIAVAGCGDGTLHWWDLASGRKLGKAATDHTDTVPALATAVLDGRPVAVTGGSDGTVRVWDLAEGEPVGAYLANDDSRVNSLATGLVEGRPVVISGSTDGVVRVWDLAAPTQSGELLTIRTGTVAALATALLHGRLVAVTGDSYGSGRAWDPVTPGTVRAWDLVTGREFGTLGDHAGESCVVTDPASGRPRAVRDGDGEVHRLHRCVTLDLNTMTSLLATDPTFECPMAISANSYAGCIWNLATGEQVGEPVWGVQAAALRMLHGRPAALLARHGRVEVWDLSTLRHLYPPLIGHEGTVRGAATAVVRGRHLAVTGGDDGSVRIWDLDGETEAGSPLSRHVGPVTGFTTAVVEGRPVIVTGGDDGSVRIWDLDSGAQLAEPLIGDTSSVNLLTVGMVDGRLTLITRGRWQEKTVQVWDLTTREQLRGRTTTEYTSSNIEFFAVLDGRFVAVDWRGRVWDLTVRRWIGVAPHEGKPLALETLEGRNVVLTGRLTQTVHLWDMATGEQIGPPMTGHTSKVRAGAAGMLDGRLVVAAGGDDGTVRVWDATTGRQTGTYTFPASIWGLAVAPDGRLVVGFGSDIAALAPR